MRKRSLFNRRFLMAGAALAAAMAMAAPAEARDFQVRRPGVCGSDGPCRAYLFDVPAGKTVRARSASCTLTVAVYNNDPPTLSASAIMLGDPRSGALISEMLPLREVSQYRHAFTLALITSYAANESIALTATGGQKLQAVIDIDPAQVQAMECHVSGTITP